MMFEQPQYLSTSISVTGVSTDAIGLQYSLLPGTIPADFGNFIAVFPADTNRFPYDIATAPTAMAQITGPARGNIILPGKFQPLMPYVVGYAVGPVLAEPAQAYGNVCATVYIPASGGSQPAAAASVSFVYVSPRELAVSYRLPAGAAPGQNGAWMGLWTGNNPSYKVPPASAVPVSSSLAEGTVIFNDVTILRGSVFSVALFMSGWSDRDTGRIQTAMACTGVGSV